MVGKKKKIKEDKPIVVVEFTVSMHCNACERNVAKVITNIKGVEKFTTDMINHKVVVEGKINPEKVLKKLKKKTGKRVELVIVEEDGEEEDSILEDNEYHALDYWRDNYYEDGETHMMFNDENANACLIM